MFIKVILQGFKAPVAVQPMAVVQAPWVKERPAVGSVRPLQAKEVATPVEAMVTVSVAESPVTVMPVPAVRVKVSLVVSATGEVPEVVEIVWKIFWSP